MRRFISENTDVETFIFYTLGHVFCIKLKQMFTVGIFTTHIPYVAFVVFYAYFLIFGVEKSNNDEIRLTDNSVRIEQHVTNFQTAPVSTYDFFAQHAGDEWQQLVISCRQVKQRWRLCLRHNLHVQEYIPDALFSRPPPAFV